MKIKERIACSVKLLANDIRANLLPTVMLVIFWLLLRVVFHGFCPVVILTGFPCPGCGLTRACLELITLHPASAFSYNPAVFLWLPFLIALIWQRYVRMKSISVFTPVFAFIALFTIIIFIWRIKTVFPGNEPMVYTSGNVMARIHPEYERFIREVISK